MHRSSFDGLTTQENPLVRSNASDFSKLGEHHFDRQVCESIEHAERILNAGTKLSWGAPSSSASTTKASLHAWLRTSYKKDSKTLNVLLRFTAKSEQVFHLDTSPALTASAESLIESNQAEFQRQHGHYFLAGAQYHVQFAVMLQLACGTEQEKVEMGTRIKAEGTTAKGQFKGEAWGDAQDGERHQTCLRQRQRLHNRRRPLCAGFREHHDRDGDAGAATEP
ncbi:hypothetical protein V8E36_009806 [Tilletia maclaganii]